MCLSRLDEIVIQTFRERKFLSIKIISFLTPRQKHQLNNKSNNDKAKGSEDKQMANIWRTALYHSFHICKNKN